MDESLDQSIMQKLADYFNFRFEDGQLVPTCYVKNQSKFRDNGCGCISTQSHQVVALLKQAGYNVTYVVPPGKNEIAATVHLDTGTGEHTPELQELFSAIEKSYWLVEKYSRWERDKRYPESKAADAWFEMRRCQEELENAWFPWTKWMLRGKIKSLEIKRAEYQARAYKIRLEDYLNEN